MSRLMRAELERQKLGGMVTRFFNHPVVLVTLLAACLGILVWTFWPASAGYLFEHGARLMASERLGDMERAWNEYLEPLERRYPDHPYRADVDRFRQKLQDARTPAPSEAQRFFRQGEQRLRVGDVQGARQVWRNLIDVFRGAGAEAEWVQRAEKAIDELDAELQAKGRWQHVRAALNRASLLHAEGKVAEAERLWTALEELYRDDPSAADIVRDVRLARRRAGK
jgi:hypothetical protein